MIRVLLVCSVQILGDMLVQCLPQKVEGLSVRWMKTPDEVETLFEKFAEGSVECDVDVVLVDDKVSGRSGNEIIESLINIFGHNLPYILMMNPSYKPSDRWVVEKPLGMMDRLVEPILKRAAAHAA